MSFERSNRFCIIVHQTIDHIGPTLQLTIYEWRSCELRCLLFVICSSRPTASRCMMIGLTISNVYFVGSHLQFDLCERQLSEVNIIDFHMVSTCGHPTALMRVLVYYTVVQNDISAASPL